LLAGQKVSQPDTRLSAAEWEELMQLLHPDHP
jgi:hypothetical protein